MNQPKVLIIEDDTDLSRAIAVRLKGIGFHVSVAQDAYQAVRYEREQRPDIVILDVNMPAGDGFIVHDRLKGFADFLAPVIYVTGQDSDDGEQKARDLGAAAYLKKPLDFNELASVIQRCLGLEAVAGQGD
ncbi:MAG: response regulator [Phycisphaerales bacterium]|nr:response regulator [Phycisphaerales bacterium]